MSNPTLSEALRQHLARHGPTTDVELHAALVTAGVTTAKTPQGVRSSLSSSPVTTQLPDGRWDLITRRLAGAVLTVRPRAVLRDDTLWIHGDLEPFTLLGTRIPLAGGGEVQHRGPEIRTLIGPKGWLPDAAPGQLLALHWDGDALSVTVLQDEPDPARVLRVRELLLLHCPDHRAYGGPSLTTAAILGALQEDPTLLAEPLLPLGELLPLPESFSAETGIWENHVAGRRLTVHVPQRVYGELERRAAMLGDRLSDYAGTLLGAAADRLAVQVDPCSCRYTQFEPERYASTPEESWADVVPLR